MDINKDAIAVMICRAGCSTLVIAIIIAVILSILNIL